MINAPLVLVVDDEEELREELAEALELAGLPCVTAGGAEEAVDHLLAQRSILAVLSDIRMPEHDGFDLLEHLRLFCTGPYAVEVVLITGHGGAAEESLAKAKWVSGFLQKPARLPELRAAVRQAVEAAAARRAAVSGE